MDWGALAAGLAQYSIGGTFFVIGLWFVTMPAKRYFTGELINRTDLDRVIAENDKLREANDLLRDQREQLLREMLDKH